MPVRPPIDAAWRSLNEQDLPALGLLARACFDADGGLPLGATEAFLAARYPTGPDGRTIAAFDPDGTLLAAAAVRTSGTPVAATAAIAGMVHPSVRNRGVGAWLMTWSLAQPARPLQVVLSTESLSGAAERLYAAHGLSCMFIEHVMRRDLADPLPLAPLPAGVTDAPWSEQTTAQFFSAYNASFRERPGFPGWTAAEWIEWISDDEDFRPDLSLVALEADRPVAFVASANGWITQAGADPAARGRGLASALIVSVLLRMRSQGAPEALLTVNANNPRARRVFERLGFVDIGRRGRYMLPSG